MTQKQNTFYALFLISILHGSVRGNDTNPSPTDSLYRFVQNIQTYNRMFPREQVYLHFDNTGYFMGETIWFKAYVVTPQGFKPTEMSRVLYVELLTPEGRVLNTQKLKIENGTFKPLTFDNVPSNALLRLIPEYSQQKERPFTIDENGKREWW